MFAKYTLSDIRIESLDNIRLIQREVDVTDKMRRFATEICAGSSLTDLEKKTWSVSLYKDKLYVPTVCRFVDTCLGIKDKGYLARRINIPDSYWNYDSNKIGRPSDALLYPLVTVDAARIGEEMLIRGGNHRAAVLYALGVRQTPVIITTQVSTTSHIEKKEADDVYMIQYNQTIEGFLKTSAWLNYKSTDCYKQSFGKYKKEIKSG